MHSLSVLVLFHYTRLFEMNAFNGLFFRSSLLYEKYYSVDVRVCVLCVYLCVASYSILGDGNICCVRVCVVSLYMGEAVVCAANLHWSIV